jgi:hypothetical protein
VSAICLRCTGSLPDQGYLCVKCCDRVRDALDDLADAWHGVVHATSGLGRRRNAATGRMSGHSDGIPVGALSVVDAASNDIATWLRALVEDRRIPDVPGVDLDALGYAWRLGYAPRVRIGVPEAARHLAESLDGVRRAPQSGAFAEDVLRASGAIVALVQPTDPPARDGRRLADHEAHLRECWTTIARAAEVLAYLRHRAPSEATIRAWAGQTGRPPRLYADGGLVLIGAVLELTDTRRTVRDRSAA